METTPVTQLKAREAATAVGVAVKELLKARHDYLENKITNDELKAFELKRIQAEANHWKAFYQN